MEGWAKKWAKLLNARLHIVLILNYVYLLTFYKQIRFSSGKKILYKCPLLSHL